MQRHNLAVMPGHPVRAAVQEGIACAADDIGHLWISRFMASVCPVGLSTHHLTYLAGSRLRGRRPPVANRQDNPRRDDVAWVDGALDSVGRLRASRSSRTRLHAGL